MGTISQTSDDLVVSLVAELVAAAPTAAVGHTAINKSSFVLQDLLGVPFGMKWELDQFGPFSRDVRPALQRCEQAGFVTIETSERGTLVRCPFEAPCPEISRVFQTKIRLLAQRTAAMRRNQLETFATAVWATRYPTTEAPSVDSRAAHVHEIKPHISVETAQQAVAYVDRLQVEVMRECEAVRIADELAKRRAEAFAGGT